MLTKEDAKRLVIARVREWDEKISGDNWYDDHALEMALDDSLAVEEFVQANPEAGLDHG